MTAKIEEEIAKAQAGRFDLDEDAVVEFDAPPRPTSPLTLQELSRVLADPSLLPAGVIATPLTGPGEMGYRTPAVQQPLRVTTSATFLTEHQDSEELWSPGNPIFPRPEMAPGDTSSAVEAVYHRNLGDLLNSIATSQEWRPF